MDTPSKNKNNNLSSDENNMTDIRFLQEELSRTKELLLDQQTNFLQLQTQHRQELEENTNSANKNFKDFQSRFEKAIIEQREIMISEFRNYQLEQESRFVKLFKEINEKLIFILYYFHVIKEEK